jgi:CDP-diacylglycerol--serine O-phosphatidyltransferase
MLMAAVASAPWLTMSVMGFAYIASIPFSMRAFRELQEAAARMEADAVDSSEGEPPPHVLPSP